MLKVILIFLNREKRNLLINKWTVPIRLFVSFLDLCFYFYAARAFIPESNAFEGLGNWNLFEFVVVGELVLFLAIDSLVIFPQQLRRAISEGVFDSLLLTKTTLIKSLTLLGIGSYLLSILTIIFQMLCLYFIFSVRFPTIWTLKVIILNLASIPFFIALGLLSSSLMLLIKRGVGLFGSLIGGLAVLSGAYFPLNVFPIWLSENILKINPLSFLLIQSRLLLKEGTGEYSILLITIIFLTLSFIVGSASRFIFDFAIKRYKQRGEKLLLGQ